MEVPSLNAALQIHRVQPPERLNEGKLAHEDSKIVGLRQSQKSPDLFQNDVGNVPDQSASDSPVCHTITKETNVREVGSNMEDEVCGSMCDGSVPTEDIDNGITPINSPEIPATVDMSLLLNGQLTPEDEICRTQQFLYKPHLTTLLEREHRQLYLDRRESHGGKPLRRRLFEEFDEVEDCLVQCDKINLKHVSEALDDGDKELHSINLTVTDNSPLRLSEVEPLLDQKIKYKSIDPMLTPIKIIEVVAENGKDNLSPERRSEQTATTDTTTVSTTTDTTTISTTSVLDSEGVAAEHGSCNEVSHREEVELSCVPKPESLLSVVPEVQSNSVVSIIHQAMSNPSNSDTCTLQTGDRKPNTEISPRRGSKRRAECLPLNLENRIYKKKKVDNPPRVQPGSPKMVHGMFTITNTPAAHTSAYPPEICKVVPIPIPDSPPLQRLGLTRRPVRVSLHPYIRRFTENEE